MNKKIKLLFVDLDGTALDATINGNPTLSEKNKKAVTRARKKGIEIVISTGRIGWNANRLIDEIGGNYFILGNGSLVINKKGQTIFEETMSKMDVIKIIDFAQKNKLILRPSFDHKVYGVSSSLKRFIVKNLGTEFASGYTLDMTINRHKVLLMGSISKSKIEKLKNKVNKKFKNLFAVTSAYGRMIEITSLGATKGLAAKFIADKLGIKKNQTAHIGDTMNDSTAKGFVGSLIAMKNADKKLKEIADYIGPHYKNGGLAKILEGKYQPNKLL